MSRDVLKIDPIREASKNNKKPEKKDVNKSKAWQLVKLLKDNEIKILSSVPFLENMSRLADQEEYEIVGKNIQQEINSHLAEEVLGDNFDYSNNKEKIDRRVMKKITSEVVENVLRKIYKNLVLIERKINEGEISSCSYALGTEHQIDLNIYDKKFVIKFGKSRLKINFYEKSDLSKIRPDKINYRLD